MSKKTTKKELVEWMKKEEEVSWIMLDSYLNEDREIPTDPQKKQDYIMWRSRWSAFRDVLRKLGEIE